MDDLVEQVVLICPHLKRDDIRADLRLTNNVDATVNRIFDGTFLQGVTAPQQPQPTINAQQRNTFLDNSDLGDLYDDDDDGDEDDDLDIDKLLSKKQPKSSSVTTQSVKKTTARSKSSTSTNTQKEVSLPPRRSNNKQKPKPAAKLTNVISLDSDDMSAPSSEATTMRRRPVDDEDDEPEDITSTKRRRVSSNLLGLAESEDEDVNNDTGSMYAESVTSVSAAPAKRGRKPKKTTDEVEEAKRKKEEEKERKRLEKEAKKAEKQREQQQKKAEKEQADAEARAARDANRLRNKYECVAEMTVELDEKFQGNQELLQSLTALGCTIEIVRQPIASSITWKRRVTRIWDPETDMFKMVPEKVEVEKFVLVYMQAEEFATIAKNGIPFGTKSNLEEIKRRYPGKTVIYLIEGFSQYYRKMKLAEQKKFEEAARRAMGNDNAGKKKSTKNKDDDIDIEEWKDMPDNNVIEQHFLWLQIEGKCQITVTPEKNQTVDWIVFFTREMSTIPYYTKRNADLNFCDLPVKSGSDATDTFVKMLELIPSITDIHAKAIVGKYKTLRNLIEEFNRIGINQLQDVVIVRAGTSTAANSRRLGPAAAKRIHDVFTARDPNQQAF